MSENSPEAYGCLFCLTGKERALAHHINTTVPDVKALVACQEKHKSVKGEKFRVEAVMFPGYVFFRAPGNLNPFLTLPSEDIIRILTTRDGDWRLAGQDEAFARWLYSVNGMLGFSEAYREGSRVKMLWGPLKDLEGQILRVDKRGRSGQVKLDFCGKTMLVWLGFEWVELSRTQEKDET